MKAKISQRIGAVAISALLLFAGGLSTAVQAAGTDTGNQSPTQQRGAPRAGDFRGRGGGGDMQRDRDMQRGGRDIENRLTGMLDTLAEEGILSEDTANAVAEFVKQRNEEQKTRREEFKDMTEEERKEYFENKKGEPPPKKQSLLSELVTAGILTQGEADAIETYLNGQEQTRRQNQLSERLDRLIEEGAVTEEQAEKILAFLTEQWEIPGKDGRKMPDKDGKDAERTHDAPQNRLQALADDGTLTQDVADKVSEVLFGRRHEKAKEAAE